MKDAIQANEETEIREKANTQITPRNLNTKGGGYPGNQTREELANKYKESHRTIRLLPTWL